MTDLTVPDEERTIVIDVNLSGGAKLTGAIDRDIEVYAGDTLTLHALRTTPSGNPVKVELRLAARPPLPPRRRWGWLRRGRS